MVFEFRILFEGGGGSKILKWDGANEGLVILKEITFGHHFYEIAITLRNAKLVNGMLCSIEALYGLTTSHLEQLEKVDRYFFRKIFNTVRSTPFESYYLETGALPLRFVVIGRRLMYLWSILHKKEDELVRQVFNVQRLMPTKGDWWPQAEKDILFLNLNLSIEEISEMKKMKFKKLVNTAIRDVAKEYLFGLKSKHTKLSNMKNEFRMQTYLTSEKLSTEEKQLLFRLRTRTFDCRSNYKNLYKSDLLCPLCKSEDSQEHLLNCDGITEGIDIEKVKYLDIFDSYQKQETAAKVFLKISRKRKLLINFPDAQGSQVHHL